MLKKILIIDDDKKFVKQIFEPLLKDWDAPYSIISNKTFGGIPDNGFDKFCKEVMSIIERNKNEIEIIFLDLMLSKNSDNTINGYKLCQEIRNDYIEIPIVALTQKEDTKYLERGFLYDFDGYLIKMNLREMGRDNFNGLINQVRRKREEFIIKIPDYYEKIALHTQKRIHESGIAHGFENIQNSMERTLTDAYSLEKKINEDKRYSAIMFCDLCNSTVIKHDQGFYEGLLATRIHNEIISDEILKNEGKIVKYIGDCVMARYDFEGKKSIDSIPINTAIKINERLSEHNTSLRKTAKYKIETKIGISIGKVVDFYGNDPQGYCVDLAARIQSIAKPKQILISEELQYCIKSSDITSRLGEASNRASNEYFKGPASRIFKGFTEKQKIYEIVWDTKPYGIKRKI